MRIVTAIVVSLLAITFGAMAQTTGNIRGVVTDETGALVPGATVTIRSDALIGEPDRGDQQLRGIPVPGDTAG